MNLTARERACLVFLGEKGTVSANSAAIGGFILRMEDTPEWPSDTSECDWIGSVVAGSLETRELVELRPGELWAITPTGRTELRRNSPSPNESSHVESDRYALSDANHGR